ncbi:hypothetical protein OROMI_028192 [Orobanche minor]
MEAINVISTRTLILALVVLLAAAIPISGTAKQLGNDDGGSLCGMSQDELFQCKPAVATGTAPPPPPSAACCAAIGHANVTCLCTFRNNKYLPYFGINSTLAMQLPTKCDPNKEIPHC